MRTPVIVRVALVLGCLTVIAAWAPRAQAGTRHVANNGVDGPACGTVAAPCRSLSKAIALASDGDKIVVGPGRYGDLDGDGVFEPADGEEAAEVGSGCSCMIEVNKRLTIAASAGSAATVLDAGGAPITVVKITADDVTFGGPTRGFTLTGAGASAGVGSTHHGLTMSAVDGKVQGCQALGNAGRGFEVGGERHTLASNLAVGNGEFGFAVDCSDCTVSRNVATGNGYAGFAVFRSASRVVDNVAIGNDLYGIQVGGGGHVVMHNSAIANRRAGLYMTGSVDVRVTANNIFGNGLDEGFWHNCGLVKAASGDLEAEGNYFGAATGPGLDPADAVCTQAPGTTDVTPFATKPFAVSPPTRR